MALSAQTISSRRTNCVARVCGCLLPVIIPPMHIAVLYYFWHHFSRKVDRHFCSCSCWDTVFKGPYESGVASYKHMYFNATFNSMKIWMVTVICIISLYESVRYLTVLALELRLRHSMLVLFISSIFAHYYSWWAYVNYWNDEFYYQWNHQMFFTLTELASTMLVLQLADTRTPVGMRKALGISGIGAMHVLVGGWDQFILNVVQGEGQMHQIVRDLGLMIPDLLHVALPLLELGRRLNNFDAELRKELTGLVILITGGFVVCSIM